MTFITPACSFLPASLYLRAFWLTPLHQHSHQTSAVEFSFFFPDHITYLVPSFQWWLYILFLNFRLLSYYLVLTILMLNRLLKFNIYAFLSAYTFLSFLPVCNLICFSFFFFFFSLRQCLCMQLHLPWNSVYKLDWFELTEISLPLSPKWWDYSCVLQHLTDYSILFYFPYIPNHVKQ